MPAIMMLQGFLMMVLPIAVMLILFFRRPLTWKALGVGAAMFFVAQLVKAPFSLGILNGMKSGALPGAGLITVLLLALVPGVWEEVLKWGPMKLLKLNTWNAVVDFAVGFGGCEALLLGVNVLLTGAMAGAGMLPSEMQAQIAAGTVGAALINLVVAVVERAGAMGLHLGFTMLNAQSFRPGRWYLLLVAMLIHTLVDVLPTAIQIGAVRVAGTIWWVEGYVVLMALVALWYTRRTIQSGEVLQGGAQAAD